MLEHKHVFCTVCDGGCLLEGVVEDGKVISVKGLPSHPLTPNTICQKAREALELYDHKDRLLYPLKRVGEKGSGKWERITWEQALDEIGEKLKQLVKQYGPETLAVTSTESLLHSNGVYRRFMNLLGSPNFTGPISLCVGNTAAVNKLTYGWYHNSHYEKTNCIVYFGRNPAPWSWCMEDARLEAALKRGAKLIVLDPIKSYTAKRADIHLPLRVGTDAAMGLGWLNVIINEELYDKDFVANWTVGFDKLKERVQEYPLQKVQEITGVPAELIREAAIMYATTKPAIMPWGVTLDKQRNSTSGLRIQCILRAITGDLDVAGGEKLDCFTPNIVSSTELALHDTLPEEKKAIQLGADKHAIYTYAGAKALREPCKRVYGMEYADLFSGSYMATPQAIFTAMRTGKPYPIKALIANANNVLMGYANQKGIYEGLKNLDLLVVYELFMTPTAQLADYVLPGDCMLERPTIINGRDGRYTTMTSKKLREAPGECKGMYYLYRELAIRMGFGEYFPWETLEGLLDYRVRATGMNWEEFSNKHMFYAPPGKKTYHEIGFATPSGKVELYSSILEDLGYDPLPYYSEPVQSVVGNLELAKEYPLPLFIGPIEPHFYLTTGRQVKRMRERTPYPKAVMRRSTGEKYDVFNGQWIWVETSLGRVKMQVDFSEDYPPDLVAVPHGWWLPEQPQGDPGLSGVWEHSTSLLIPDDDENVDPEQGVADMRGGLLCKIYPA